MTTSKYRYVDGRQFEQQPDGTWGPTHHQRLLDQDKLAIKAAQATKRAVSANNAVPPAPCRCSASDSIQPFATGMLLGGLFLGD